MDLTGCANFAKKFSSAIISLNSAEPKNVAEMLLQLSGVHEDRLKVISEAMSNLNSFNLNDLVSYVLKLCPSLPDYEEGFKLLTQYFSTNSAFEIASFHDILFMLKKHFRFDIDQKLMSIALLWKIADDVNSNAKDIIYHLIDADLINSKHPQLIEDSIIKRFSQEISHSYCFSQLQI